MVATAGAYRWLFLGCLLSLTVCQAMWVPAYSSISAAATSGMVPFNVRAWLELLGQKISRLRSTIDDPKRGCNGFPCMYSHLGDKAGRESMMRSRMNYIHDCAHDPNCSPGKRRKRDASFGLLKLLKQRRNTS